MGESVITLSRGSNKKTKELLKLVQQRKVNKYN
jgi:hypothetical protein